MKKLYRYILLSFIFISLCISNNFVLGQESQKQSAPKLHYVKSDQENIRLSPNGSIIGQVKKSTELTVLDKQGKWIKVAVIGWIWEASTSSDKESTLGPKYRASIIMLETREEAEAVLTRLKAGEDFGILAKAKSVHPTANKDGDLGFFRKGEFSPEFERAIFAVKPDQFTGIVDVKVQDETYYCIFKRVK